MCVCKVGGGGKEVTGEGRTEGLGPLLKLFE